MHDWPFPIHDIVHVQTADSMSQKKNKQHFHTHVVHFIIFQLYYL